MASEDSSETGPGSGSTEDNVVPSEQVSLVNFAHSIASCNFVSEPGIADDGNTRREAKLLMSLLSAPLKPEDEDLGAVSSSDSEPSYMSDSSSSTRRDVFSFVCPSLSLESWESPHRESNLREGLARRVSDVLEPDKKYYESHEKPPPSVLFGRRLRVDDRDALRLSADAMARNVLQSFQKAISWRIQAWMTALSDSLVKKEMEMTRQGASLEQLKTLLDTSEARLILALREVSEHIIVTGAGTSFRVLPQRLENHDTAEPSSKKRKVDREPSDWEEGEYQYTVTYALLFESGVNLQTPAGFSEISLQVPGTMEGTFLTTEPGTEELTSVVVELDTDILAAMVEKSCRTIVRTSVEASMRPALSEEPKIESPMPVATGTTVPSTCTPTTGPPNLDITPESVRAALVTPRNRVSDGSSSTNDRSPVPILLPIPDDLEDKQSRVPRRISPQPNSPELATCSGYKIAPRPTSSAKSLLTSAAATMVSPLGGDSTEYHDTSANGPSLPMLVEAATRVMHGN